uniref:aldose epimerase family protein n=1 Tax=Agathobacter sp. TaxID=2021311 RepID=UPI00405768C7
MKQRSFGKNTKGEAAALYTFENKNGMIMEVSDFGATLYALWVPDKEGTLRDVVLGYDDPIGYEGPSGTFFGATVGRNANRIGKGIFTLNGKEYHLDKNNGNNNLHSGLDFYSFRIWEVKETAENSITFTLHSPDGDQGYPGELDMEVTYTLTEDNAVKIDYYAVPNADTIINMTNHSYFNLNGHDSGSVLTQSVWVDADAFTRADEESIPTGEIVSVEGTPMDFRVKKELGRNIEEAYEALIFGKGYDHNWCLNNHGEFAKVAEMSAEESGITLEVYTDLPGVQLYSGNFIMEESGKEGAVYHQRQGLCFETQYYPDAIHHENFESPVCKAGEAYQTTTMYKFV